MSIDVLHREIHNTDACGREIEQFVGDVRGVGSDDVDKAHETIVDYGGKVEPKGSGKSSIGKIRALFMLIAP
jgi:hypothetical protein